MVLGIRREGAEYVNRGRRKWQKKKKKKVCEVVSDVELSLDRVSLKICRTHLRTDPPKLRRLKH